MGRKANCLMSLCMYPSLNVQFLMVDIITFKTFQIIFLLNTNIPHLLSAVRLYSPCRAPKQPVSRAISAPVYVYLIVVSSSNSLPHLHWQNQQGTQKRIFSIIVLHLVTLLRAFEFFLLKDTHKRCARF